MTELRRLRLAEEISGGDLSRAAGIPWNRLCQLELCRIQPRAGELERLSAALNRLIEAKRRVQAFAVEASLPLSA